MKNIEQIRIVRYRYATEFAEEVGIKEDTGVIAQEIQQILPDAVQPGGDVILPSGEVIENFLVVNKVGSYFFYELLILIWLMIDEFGTFNSAILILLFICLSTENSQNMYLRNV